ncbi:MAG: 6,7-dimethyl-8-ribityllumazine synthase [Fibrobacterota bacterium]
MTKTVEGMLRGEGKKFALVTGRFNDFITEKLQNGALDGLIRHEVSSDDISIVKVPGAFEIPLAAKRLAKSKRFDAVICLGAIIRGATPHFEYVAAELTKGIAQVSMETEVPVVFGVLTTDTIEQAVERAGTKSGNKGFDAALTALEMANVMEKI